MTPEGRTIEPRDSAWWSLMVRNARSFITVYHQASKLRQQVQALEARLSMYATQALEGSRLRDGASAEGAGLVPYKTNQKTSADVENPMLNRHQDDVIMQAWPTHCDSPTPLTPLHAPRPTTSESPSTPSYALPWTPTCAVQLRYQRPNLRPHLASCVKPNQQPNGQNLSLSLSPNSPPSSPEPKRSGSTTSATACSGADSSSARPAAANAAKLASASGGAQ